MIIGDSTGIKFNKPVTNFQTVSQVVHSTITEDTLTEDLIPSNYMLEAIIFENTTANEAILDAGTSDGGNDIFTEQTIAASTITTIVINKVFSTTLATDFDINDTQVGSDWNSASLNMTFILAKIGVR